MYCTVKIDKYKIKIKLIGGDAVGEIHGEYEIIVLTLHSFYMLNEEPTLISVLYSK